MHPKPHTSDFSLASGRHLLFIGFEDGFDGLIRHFPYDGPNYPYKVEDNGFSAYLWLTEQVKSLPTYHLPYAILCHLDWLIQDKYRLAQQLADHPDLRSVPIIAFTLKGKPANKTVLSTNGIDDCYTVPVEWSTLESRLIFLNQYKPQLIEIPQRTKHEHFVFRIPWTKRIFDLFGGIVGIVLTSVIWIPTMLAIWLESGGPVMYRSKRVGSGYQVFDFFKFRSMCVGAEDQLQHMQNLNQYAPDATNGKANFMKIIGDPRVTRVGRFIRKYSIDELPQLINVLRGEMSLVGNRPLPLYEAETLTNDEWSARFIAPAGITGLWQISKRGRPEMTSEERIRLDIAYSHKKYAIWDDFVIVLKTFYSFIQKEDV